MQMQSQKQRSSARTTRQSDRSLNHLRPVERAAYDAPSRWVITGQGDEMNLWDWIWVVLASLAVVMVWLAADRLSNHWWRLLPEPIREKGLIRWLISRK
jgi:hypothetical protein